MEDLEATYYKNHVSKNGIGIEDNKYDFMESQNVW